MPKFPYKSGRVGIYRYLTKLVLRFQNRPVTVDFMARGVRLCAVTAFVSLLAPVYAGDVVDEVLITKRLTKRALTPPVYNLRGAVPQASHEVDNTNEFDKTIVMLEGGKMPPLA